MSSHLESSTVVSHLSCLLPRPALNQSLQLFDAVLAFCVHTSALRGSLKARNSLISYGSFLTGASLIAFSQSAKFRQLGRVVAALSVAFFWVHRWRLSAAYRSITGYISDLEDIGRHYGVVTVRTGQVDSHENGKEGESSVITGKSGFWVAEAVDSAGEPTGRIVGCTGLGTLGYSPTHRTVS